MLGDSHDCCFELGVLQMLDLIIILQVIKEASWRLRSTGPSSCVDSLNFARFFKSLTLGLGLG